jgi:hypothetical protein
VVSRRDESAAPSHVEGNELQAFVASTLIAIMKGVSEAQASARAGSAHGTGEYAFSPPKEVAFDIAVNAKRTGSREGGFKVEVFSIGANAGGAATSEDSTVSRIQFTIPAKFKSRSDRKSEDAEAV